MQRGISPLSPPPANLKLASSSSPWKVIWKMLGIVILLYLLTQFFVIVVYGLYENDPFLTAVGGICLLPLLALHLFVTRPKLTHILVASPNQEGSNQHMITKNRMLQTPIPTTFEHHLVRNSEPVEFPKTSTLWFVFGVTVLVSFLGLLPVFLDNSNPLYVVLALMIGIPAWLFGFSLPVHAWWAFSTRYLEIMTTRYAAENMLIAGMLSTIPAIIINSLIFPETLNFIGITDHGPGSIGELLILAISAPVGEELCKAGFVLLLYRLIDSPRRGFQIGFSVGLGFAMLENLQYILFSLLNEEAAISYSLTAIIRGIGSIPGHAFWTSLSGLSIGWWLCRTRGMVINSENRQIQQNWMVFDSNSGQLVDVNSSDSAISLKLKRWLYKPVERTWSLPKEPIIGIMFAISGHSIWNGSSWIISKITEDMSLISHLIINLVWIGILISGLWFIARQVLASVLHIPHFQIEFNKRT
ncbi:MAG: PrsW family glutamic-type intramembrane protease [Candidatus Poseidoniaceae archaeon]|jgi:RsiW-degrading membrane proteinase PrsW (M82 family)|nr:PrsW family glutamic-type intramembrane protease [Candidatus Poseidoniaceae archaeon]